MNIAIGVGGVVLALVAALSGAVTIIIGLRYSREKLLILGARYSWLVLAGMIMATFAMQRALITRDFSIKFAIIDFFFNDLKENQICGGTCRILLVEDLRIILRSFNLVSIK